MVGRVLHAVGMDNPEVGKPRMIGMLATMLPMLGLAVVAVLIALKLF